MMSSSEKTLDSTLHAQSMVIDDLVEKIREEAQLNEIKQSLAIDDWIELWRKRLAFIYQANEIHLYNPQTPQLAELLSPHLSDERFITRAYTVLLGRLPDEEGLDFYKGLLRNQGRIIVLIVFLQTEEAKKSIRLHNIVIPKVLLIQNRIDRFFNSMPIMRSVGQKVWRELLNRFWRLRENRWKELGQYYEFLATESQRDEKYWSLAITLQEITIMQKYIVSGIGISASSTVEDGGRSLQEKCDDKHAVAILELLRDAQAVHKTKNEELP